jgi:1,4-alpha-glucan branching enzyme
LDDLKNLIKVAHDNDIFIILDWVPNHSGWDNPWITEHPEYYVRNAEGKITDPLGGDGKSMGWTDVADLDYNNQEMRKAMIESMQYWLKEVDVDGFRCDVAGMVPMDFWQQAIPQLRAVKPIFMLAEDAAPEMVKGDGMFDMIYGWEAHHLMKAIVKGEKNVQDWDNMMSQLQTKYEKDDIIMNFTQNHDENSWNGTHSESFGNAGEVMTILTYMIPGMPLIYSGMEYDLNHKLKFFEKDSIPKVKGKYFPLYEKLAFLKQNNTAMSGGKHPASYIRINTGKNDQLLAFVRERDGKKAIFIGNLSPNPVETTLDLDGKSSDYFNGEKKEFQKGNVISLGPWEYLVLE